MKKNFTQRITVFFLVTTIIFNSSYAQQFSALDYNGASSQFVTMPSNLVSTLFADYSIEMWVYWRGGADFQRVFDFGTGTSAYMFFTPSNGTSHTPRFSITTGGPGTEEQITSASALTTNVWHDVAISMQFNSGTMLYTGTLYVDGVAQGTNAAIDIAPGDFALTPPTNYLGKSQFSGDPYFDGVIDELLISNVARYTADYTPFHSEFSSDFATVALYHFDEGAGQFANDASGQQSAGILGADATIETADPTWTTAIIAPLPVGLEYFKGVPSGTDAQLTWKTATEQNNKGFDVERSTDGVSFSSISFVNGAGNSTVEVSYSYTDYNVQSPTVWYRLKQEDIDGNATFSGIVQLSFNSVTKLYWYAAGEHTIEVRLTNGNDENFSVTDMSGRVIRRGNLVAGKTLLASLSQGAYTVSVIQKNGTILSIPVLSK